VIIDGPYTVVVNVPTLVTDPAKYTPQSAKVQVQNNTGLNLRCLIGGFVYPIPPYTSSTIPTRVSPDLLLNPSAGVTTGNGPVTLVWLLEGEDSAQPDGPLLGATKVI
jgi:hypothetical protein